MKTVFITGASGGIGSAVARLFAARGYATALGCHAHPQKAQALADEITAGGGMAKVYPADVTRSDALTGALTAAQADFGFIGTLINAAGSAQNTLLQDISDTQWNNLLHTNLSCVFYACRAVLPEMIRRRQGAIVNVSSVWGVRGAACETAYSAAKAGINGLTMALAKEVGPSGIRVNCVAPGVIDTPMNAGHSAADMAALAQDTPLGRIGTPAEVAAAIYFLASDEAAFITGQTLVVDGGFIL